MAVKKKASTKKTARKKTPVKKKQAKKDSFNNKATSVKKKASAAKKKSPVKKKAARPDDRTLLLEIGTEEIPARFFPLGRFVLLEEALKKALESARIDIGGVDSMNHTPRRIVITVKDIAEMQRDEIREAFGPPRQACYDSDGNMTKAALGFARSQGVDPSTLTFKPKEGKGEYAVVVIDEKGVPSHKVLPEILKEFILSIGFPKSMRWGDGTIRFARPIHWVVALLGDKVLSFELEGIKSGRTTRGHRFLAPGKIKLESPGDYKDILRSKGKVVVDTFIREQIIVGECNDLAKEAGGEPVFADENFKRELSNIVEAPYCVLGDFEEKYLELPDELLTSVMVGHQKYVPVKGKSGRLTNNFIIVSNTVAKNAGTVKKGAERVLRARFDDAVFYFKDDRERKLSDRLEALRKVTFQDKLGSLYDKTMRVKEAAAKVADLIAPEAKADAVRAAELAKCDLLSGVVYEFPELQGIMGMYYARMDGEGDAVADAIREQYLPAFSGDKVPGTDSGTVLSIAEKLDNIASFFSIGLKPTGSEDPYALRRQALGIISIMREKKYDVSISALLDTVAEEGLKAELSEFFEQRLEPLLLARGYQYDVVQAQIGNSTKLPLSELFKRIDCLTSFKVNDGYNEFLIAIKRVRNIITGVHMPEARPEFFIEDEERLLDSVVDSVSGDLRMYAEQCQCEKATETLLRLTAPINSFFEKVLVMDKDEALRNNRLALLNEIWQMVSSLADFSRLDERQ